MPGPMPKDPGGRQRRNRGATRATLPAERAPRQRAPRLPRVEGITWHRLTRAWWSDVWHSPMATEYVRADEHALLRLAVLVNAFWERPDLDVARELRLEQQAFGLSPLDRRRLEWSIDQAEQATERRAQRKVRRAQAGEIDPREALRVVGE